MYWLANIVRYIGYVICVFSFVYIVALIYSGSAFSDYVNPIILGITGLGLQFIAYLMLPRIQQDEEGKTITKHL